MATTTKNYSNEHPKYKTEDNNNIKTAWVPPGALTGGDVPKGFYLIRVPLDRPRVGGNQYRWELKPIRKKGKK